MVIFLLAHHYSGITFVSWEDDDIIHGPKVFQGTPLNLGQVGFGRFGLSQEPTKPPPEVPRWLQAKGLAV